MSQVLVSGTIPSLRAAYGRLQIRGALGNIASYNKSCGTTTGSETMNARAFSEGPFLHYPGALGVGGTYITIVHESSGPEPPHPCHPTLCETQTLVYASPYS